MSAEQAALIEKAQASLRAARLLATEGLFSFAVSRAYYTMFYVAEAFLLGEGLAFSKHSAVIAKFGEHFAKTGRVPVEYHRYLIEGSDRRNVGDYDIGPELTKAESSNQIARAERFLELANQLLGDPPIS